MVLHEAVDAALVLAPVVVDQQEQLAALGGGTVAFATPASVRMGKR